MIEKFIEAQYPNRWKANSKHITSVRKIPCRVVAALEI